MLASAGNSWKLISINLMPTLPSASQCIRHPMPTLPLANIVKVSYRHWLISKKWIAKCPRVTKKALRVQRKGIRKCVNRIPNFINSVFFYFSSYPVIFDKAFLYYLFKAPDGAPEKVHCVALTSSTIQVSWHPTEAHLRNGIIEGYKVQLNSPNAFLCIVTFNHSVILF